MWNFIRFDIDSSLQTNDSTVIVTRFWLDLTKSWLDSDWSRTILDGSDSKGLWLWLDKIDSGTSLVFGVGLLILGFWFRELGSRFLVWHWRQNNASRYFASGRKLDIANYSMATCKPDWKNTMSSVHWRLMGWISRAMGSPVSSEISDLGYFRLHTMYACTE